LRRTGRGQRCSTAVRRSCSNNLRAALRWLGRYVTEGKAVSLLKALSLLKAQLALAALAELRTGERESAAKMLTELAR
jgi:hypothetical protein